MEQPNLGADLLRRLLAGEVRNRRRRNVDQARAFSEMLEDAPLPEPRDRGGPGNRRVDSAREGDEREAEARGEELGLSGDELAFYDALGRAIAPSQ
jgi:type I restriction enzyme, R subunit